jgi:diguanylate cyclase (GGDEF)-like protein/PAS domain S-box-containing protein
MKYSNSNQQPILFVRSPQLEQMRDPLRASWNEELASKETKADSDINLAQLVNFSQMNDVFSSYLEVIGLPVAIIDLDGLVLASSNWQRLCMEFHRTNQGTLARCIESDTSLSRQMQEGKAYAIYRCQNGLTDCATPIIIEGHHIANLFIGQFFLNPPDLKEFEMRCAEFSFDHVSYFQALAEVPIIEEEKIPAILKMLVGFASLIASQSLAEHRAIIAYKSVEKQVAERTQLLTEALDFNESILLNSPLPIGVYAANGQCILANDAHCKLVGATRDTLLSRNFNNIVSWQESGLLDSCRVALAQHNSQHGEMHVVTSFGNEIWLEYQVSPAKLNGEDHVLVQFVDLTQRKKLEDELRQFAFHDSLTRLPNRRLLLDRMEQAFRTSKRQNSYGAVLFVDLNKFKQLNDQHGHDVGDRLLVEVAHRLQNLMRESDTVARIGGDEFVVLLEGLGEEPDEASAQAAAVAVKIHAVLRMEYVLGDILHHGSASVGLRLFLGDDGDPDQILKEADAAMYKEKTGAVC